jgi:biopolymer transport protein ExbD
LGVLSFAVFSGWSCSSSDTQSFATLVIKSDSTFELNGKAVSAADLRKGLLELKPSIGELQVALKVDRSAKHDAVVVAMQALQAVDARIGLSAGVYP